MKIAIIGGTGSIGKGFALRWGHKHHVIIGSREQEKARARAVEYTSILKDHGQKADITGEVNVKAASEADIILLAIRYGQISTILGQIKAEIENKIVISVVVPMEKDRCIIVPNGVPLEISTNSREDYKADYFCYVTPPAGSAAQEIASLLPAGTELVSAFHNIPAAKLSNLDVELGYDIGVCGNYMHSKNIVFGLVRDIPGLRPLDIGPLETSSMVESITPLLVNVAIRNHMKDVGIKFVD
jgi:NADPH-dependent F420 reductase